MEADEGFDDSLDGECEDAYGRSILAYRCPINAPPLRELS